MQKSGFPTQKQPSFHVPSTPRYGVIVILMMGFMLFHILYSVDILLDGRLLDGSLLDRLKGDVQARDRLVGPIGIVKIYDYRNPFATPLFSYILSLLALFTFSNFLQHKQKTPKLMIAFFVLLLMHATWEVILVNTSTSYRMHTPYRDARAYSKLLLYGILCVPAIWYLIRSKRVKALFTK